MATYDEIHGKRIKEFSDDPTLNSSYEGQVWYNSTSGNLKSVVSFAAWASGSNVAVARINGSASGIQTAAVYAGGNAPPYSTATEEYDGTGFAAGGNMNDNRDPYAGFGTLTDTVTAGGYDGSNKAESETYNGTSWSEGNNLNTARRGNQGFGTSGDAGVCCGGFTTTASTATEEYNGTSWTTVNAMPTARYSGCATGAQDSGIQVGGDPGSVTTSFEYDGTDWSSGGALATGRSFIMLGGATQDAVIAFGGETSPGTISTSSENYDGTSWTTGATTGTGHKNISCGGWGTKTATFAAFGNGPPGSQISTTEEYNISVNTVTPAAWASGGNLNTARYSLGGFGESHTTAVAFVGRDTPIYNATEEYNGSSWTTVNNYPQSVNDVGSCGVLTAGLGLGGLNPPSVGTFPTTGRITAEYDGTNWTTGGSYTYDAWGTGCAGTQTATIASGGHNYPMPPGNRNDSAEYNGTAWTAGNNMSQVRAIFAAGGSQTASFACGGRSSPGVEDPTNACEEYDGTNWTSGGNYVVAVKENSAGGGPQTSGYVAGGAAPSATAICGLYDGTTWSTTAALPGAQQLNGATSNNTGPAGAMSFGGGTDKDATYEFTQESLAVTAKSLAST